MKTVIMPQGLNEDLVRLQEINQFATTEDFCRFLDENLDGLHQLAFLLTRDQEMAEQCFVAGLEDCVKANGLSADCGLTPKFRCSRNHQRSPGDKVDAQAAQHKLTLLGVANPKRMRAVCVCTLVFLLLLPGAGVAQEQMARPSTPDNSLPDTPLPQHEDPMQNSESTGNGEGTASVSGMVRDATGAVIPNAQVELTLRDGRRLQTIRSDANGEFTFSRVPAGSYLVTVEAVGFAPFTTKEFALASQQVYLVPEILLSVESSTTSIVVRPPEVIAAEQIKAEEKQRVFGVFPNFYVSYVPDAAPLTSKQKFSMAAHDTFDWTSFLGVSLGAGIQQATNAHPGYRQGVAGYGKRWGALFANGRSSDLLSHYVFASLLHQDPRYFYQGTGTTKSRFYHALSNAFVARSDSGKTMPNYSYLLGDLCSAALSNAYYPPADRGASLVFTNAALGIAGRAAQGLFQEFIAKRLTKHVPGSK